MTLRTKPVTQSSLDEDVQRILDEGLINLGINSASQDTWTGANGNNITLGEAQLGTSGVYEVDRKDYGTDLGYTNAFYGAANISLAVTFMASTFSGSVQHIEGIVDETTGASPGNLYTHAVYQYNTADGSGSYNLKTSTGVTAVLVTDDGSGNVDVDIAAAGTGQVSASSLPTYADDTAAGGGGLASGNIYKTVTGELRIKT